MCSLSPWVEVLSRDQKQQSTKKEDHWRASWVRNRLPFTKPLKCWLFITAVSLPRLIQYCERTATTYFISFWLSAHHRPSLLLVTTFLFPPWRRKWQLTPVFLPGESHGRRSLLGYSPLVSKESDTTEWLHSLTFSFPSPSQVNPSANQDGPPSPGLGVGTSPNISLSESLSWGFGSWAE